MIKKLPRNVKHLLIVTFGEKWATEDERRRMNKKAGFSEWAQGDGDGSNDWRWGLLGPGLAKLPIGLAQTANAATIAAHESRRPLEGSIDDAVFRDAIKQKAEASGAKVVNAEGWVNKNPGILEEIITKLTGVRPRPQGTSYVPATKEILMHPNQSGAAFMAHELGHHHGGAGLMNVNMAGKGITGLASTIAALQPHEDTSAVAAGVGTAAGLGTLASELDASRRGYRLMRQAGSGRKGALMAFAGIPSYLAYAALPGATWGIKKHMGGFDKQNVTDAKTVQ